MLYINYYHLSFFIMFSNALTFYECYRFKCHNPNWLDCVLTLTGWPKGLTLTGWTKGLTLTGWPKGLTEACVY